MGLTESPYHPAMCLPSSNKRSPENRFIYFVLPVLFYFGVSIALPNSDPQQVPSNFEDEGACPFECCTYREWTINTETVFYNDRNTSSEVVFKSFKNEIVTGLPGVVITLVPGESAVKKAITLGQDDRVDAKPKDVLYLLHYEGEGFFKFWFRGKVYSDEFPFANEKNEHLETLSEPQTVWWVKVRNGSGQTGWSKETNHFDHMDACE
jgi:hypothetical protein